MTAKSGNEITFYGSVTVERGWCPKCKSMSIVRFGCFVCCGAESPDDVVRYTRESEAVSKRKRPSPTEQWSILNAQGNRCFYCGVRFGAIRYRGHKKIVLKLNWDHAIPFSYVQSNRKQNFVAACHVCNRIKADKIFETFDAAKEELTKRRAELGYDF